MPRAERQEGERPPLVQSGAPPRLRKRRREGAETRYLIRGRHLEAVSDPHLRGKGGFPLFLTLPDALGMYSRVARVRACERAGVTGETGKPVRMRQPDLCAPASEGRSCSPTKTRPRSVLRFKA